MINEQLSQWETDAMYDRAVCRYFGTPTRDSDRVLALIAEVRRLQGEDEQKAVAWWRIKSGEFDDALKNQGWI